MPILFYGPIGDEDLCAKISSTIQLISSMDPKLLDENLNK